jgi:hypothetical protein
MIGWLNADIERCNGELEPYVRQRVADRMAEVGAQSASFMSLAEALGAELKPTSGTQRRIQDAPKLRPAIAELRRPRAKGERIPRLQPTELQTILAVIDAMGATFERTPRTVAKLDEEDIRNLILGALNAAFDLNAVGEAFSARGKADIYLVVPRGGIFIAEAKLWGGPKKISDAAGQILGYLTWRDAYGVVLVFSRNQGFSGVREALPEAIAGPSLRGEVHQLDDHHWTARHAIPGDDHQTVELHYLVYNIFAE